MAIKVNTRRVNAAMKREGIPFTLYRGTGYFYFIPTNPADPREHSVYVNTITELTLEQWLAEARRVNARPWEETAE